MLKRPVAPRVVIRRASAMQLAETASALAEARGMLLTRRARTVYRVLARASHLLLQLRGASPGATRCAFFTVLDVLPYLTSMGRATMYRALADLRTVGLVDWRPWYTEGLRRNVPGGTTVRGTVTGGVVMEVVLMPATGRAARVRESDLRHQHRNLDRDRSAGRTAWQWIQERTEAQADVNAHVLAGRLPQALEVAEQYGLDHAGLPVRQSDSSIQERMLMTSLLTWAISGPGDSPPDIQTVSRATRPPLECVYALGELVNTHPQERGERLDRQARALATMFGDGAHSLSFWRWLLWRALTAELQDQGALQALQAMLARLLADTAEWRELRSVGALLISRLKCGGWWTILKTAGAS